MEFTGGNKNDLVFKGKVTRRKYRAGNNQHHKVIRVHPQDYEGFLAMKYFREYRGQDTQKMVSTPEPKPPPKPKAKEMPKPLEMPEPLPIPEIEVAKPDSGELDITTMKVRDIFQYDFTLLNPRAMGILISQEEENKNRKTVLAYLRKQRDKMKGGPSTSSTTEEEADGTSEHSNPTKP